MKLLSLVALLVLGVACGGVSNVDDNTSRNSNTPTPITVSAVQTVTIDSPDGVKIVGSYFEARKPNSPAVLLLHQWQSDRHSYDDFAKQMQTRGINVLSIDGRGFGDSTKNADGASVTAGRTNADVKAMLGDVDAAFRFLSMRPNVNSKRVGIVGASYGSSLAIIYAAGHPDVQAVALLSPGLNYFGNLPTEPAVAKFRDRNNHNLLFIAADDDKESADAVEKLDPIEVDNYRFSRQTFESGGHGTELLKVGAAETMSDFFADIFDLANLHVRT